MAERIGRKKAAIVIGAAYTIGYGVTIIAMHPIVLYLARFIIGKPYSLRSLFNKVIMNFHRCRHGRELRCYSNVHFGVCRNINQRTVGNVFSTFSNYWHPAGVRCWCTNNMGKPELGMCRRASFAHCWHVLHPRESSLASQASK